MASVTIHGTRRRFAMLVIVTSTAWSPRPSSAVVAGTSIAYRAERADVVVVGRISAYDQNKRVTLSFDEDGTTDVNRGQRTQQWLNQATLEVTEVLKATVDVPSSIPVMSLGMFDRSEEPGKLWEYAENDERDLQVGTQGIWFLKQVAWNDYRLLSLGHLPVDSLKYVRNCIWQLDTRYRHVKPGLPIDDESWVIPINSTGTRIAVATDGTVFMCGLVRRELRLQDGFPPIEFGEVGLFMARAHYDGTFIWKQGSVYDWGTTVDDIVVDGNGQCTVAVLREERGPVNSPSNDRGRATVEHSNHAGKARWVHEIKDVSGAGDLISAIKLAARTSGEIVVACTFRGRVEWGDQVFESVGGTDILLGEIDNQGKLRWSKLIGGTDDESCVAVDLSKRGDIVLGGSVGSQGHERGKNGRGAMVVMCSAGGDERWRRTVSDSSGSSLLAIACTHNQGVVASIKVGTSGSSRALYLYAWSRDGALKWSEPGGGADVAVGPHNEIVTTGTYGQGAPPVPNLPAPMGDEDVYVQCFTSKGKLMWTWRDGGMGAESGRFVDVSWGRLILCGGYDGMSYIAGQVIADFEPKQYSSYIANVPFPTRRKR